MKTVSLQYMKNITTGILHTNMVEIKEAMSFFTGIEDIFCASMIAIQNGIVPVLKQKYPNPILWDDTYTPELQGEMQIEPFTDEEMQLFNKSFGF